MARRKADGPMERGGRRAETNAVAACLTALRAPKVPPRSRASLERRRAQIEQWLSEGSSPIREVELIQQCLDNDAQLARIDQAARLPGARGGVREGGRRVGEAHWGQRCGASRGGRAGAGACESGALGYIDRR
jgi:hypothetical protein